MRMAISCFTSFPIGQFVQNTFAIGHSVYVPVHLLVARPRVMDLAQSREGATLVFKCHVTLRRQSNACSEKIETVS